MNNQPQNATSYTGPFQFVSNFCALPYQFAMICVVFGEIRNGYLLCIYDLYPSRYVTCIELITVHIYNPCTDYNIKYHNFRS